MSGALYFLFKAAKDWRELSNAFEVTQNKTKRDFGSGSVEITLAFGSKSIGSFIRTIFSLILLVIYTNYLKMTFGETYCHLHILSNYFYPLTLMYFPILYKHSIFHINLAYYKTNEFNLQNIFRLHFLFCAPIKTNLIHKVISTLLNCLK